MLKPININDIPAGKSERVGPWPPIVAEFISSGLPAAECEIEQDARQAYSGLYHFCTYHSLPVTVLRRGNRVFLIRKEAANAE